MPKDYCRDLTKILAEAGWEKSDGGKGSHEEGIHRATGRMIVIPHSKRRHTTNEALKQAGLKKAF